MYPRAHFSLKKTLALLSSHLPFFLTYLRQQSFILFADSRRIQNKDILHVTQFDVVVVVTRIVGLTNSPLTRRTNTFIMNKSLPFVYILYVYGMTLGRDESLKYKIAARNRLEAN